MKRAARIFARAFAERLGAELRGFAAEGPDGADATAADGADADPADGAHAPHPDRGRGA